MQVINYGRWVNFLLLTETSWERGLSDSSAVLDGIFYHVSPPNFMGFLPIYYYVWKVTNLKDSSTVENWFHINCSIFK